MPIVVSSSCDGARLLVVSGPIPHYKFFIWDFQQDKIIQSRDVETLVFSKVAQWSPINNQVAVATGNGSIFIWNLDQDDLLELKADRGVDPNNGCTSLSYSPTGEFLLAGYADSSVRIWNISDERVIRVISGHSHGYKGPAITSVAWSPDGDTLALFSAAEGTPWKPSQNTKTTIPELAGLGPYLQIEFAGPNEEAAMKLGPNIYLWSSKGNRLIMKISRESPWALRLTRLMMRVNEQLAAKVPRKLSWGGWIYALAFSPNGKYIAAADGMGVAIWRLARPFRMARQVHQLEFADYVKRSLCFSPDGRFLAVGNERSIHLLDLQSDSSYKHLEPAGGWWRGSSLGFLWKDNRQFLAADRLDSIVLWDCLSGERVREIGSSFFADHRPSSARNQAA